MRITYGWILMGALALVACGSDDGSGSVDIVETPLAGRVGGAPWTFVAGETSAFLSEGEDEFFAELYDSTFTTCDNDAPSSDVLLLSVPKETGSYELSLGLSMTFVADNENFIVTAGRIEVDEVTDTVVRGGLYAKYDADNEVNGRFEIANCPE